MTHHKNVALSVISNICTTPKDISTDENGQSAEMAPLLIN